MSYDVFISHASADRKVATTMCAVLERHGSRCWVAPRDIKPGVSYGAAIVDALNHTRVLVLILSGPANLSIHVAKEVERAVSKGVNVIPFRIEDVLPARDLEYFVSAEHWLDAITPPMERHLRDLNEAVRALVQLGAEGPLQDAEHSESDRVSAIQAFDEVAPDDWRRRRRHSFLYWLLSIFDEKS